MLNDHFENKDNAEVGLPFQTQIVIVVSLIILGKVGLLNICFH
jgi:hypothetical protein